MLEPKNSLWMNIWYINWIIMENEQQVPAAESEAHRLVKNNFRRQS